ncbi:MAG: membrane protein insertion efficiency factor YidD [Candidatus Sumerlaeia bacterium]|nr:membrane protein insertion efficiency factor YidD [Candidatus Sumerlaeia bacterium]
MPQGTQTSPTERPQTAGIAFALRALIRLPDAALRYPLLVLVLLYQILLSPFTGGQCRFYPTCSEYAMAVLMRRPIWRALPLICWRLLRCQPLCKGGVDLVADWEGEPHWRLPWKWVRKSRSWVKP